MCVCVCLTALTGLVPPEGFLGLMPHGLAVLLESEVAGLLPGWGADLEKISSLQEELQIHIPLQAWETDRWGGVK